MKKKRKGGWQFWVDDAGGYMIKTPKSREEISDSVTKWLEYINKLEEYNKRVNDVIRDLNYSTKLIIKSKIPLSYFADLEFLEDGKLKQKKVVVLEDRLNELTNSNGVKQAKKLIDKSVDLLIELWKYGLHEKTYKFYSNFGILNKEVFLIDPFELTGNKKKVEKQIRNRKRYNQMKYSKDSLKELSVYFVKKMDEKMTLENLNKIWKQNLK